LGITASGDMFPASLQWPLRYSAPHMHDYKLVEQT
jgi:hypothetical protein